MQVGVPVSEVTCPQPAPTSPYTCTAAFEGGGALEVAVTPGAGGAASTWKLAHRYVARDPIQQQIAAFFAQNGKSNAAVTCGAQAVYPLVAANHALRCNALVPGDKMYLLEVTLDEADRPRWRVLPAQTPSVPAVSPAPSTPTMPTAPASASTTPPEPSPKPAPAPTAPAAAP